MDWKIYACDCLNNYLTTFELEELDDFLQACIKKTQTKKHRPSRTLSTSDVVYFYSFSTRDQKNKLHVE